MKRRVFFGRAAAAVATLPRAGMAADAETGWCFRCGALNAPLVRIETLPIPEAFAAGPLRWCVVCSRTPLTLNEWWRLFPVWTVEPL